MEAVEYLEDPDFVMIVHVVDDDTGKDQTIEVGYGYKDGKKGPLYYLNTDPYSRQMMAEATTMRTKPFVRQKVQGVRDPDAQPQLCYRPKPGLRSSLS